MNSNTCFNTQNNSYRKWAIGNDIREILSSNEELVEMVGSNIFPLVAPENIAGNFIIYQREKYSKLISKMGVYEDECLVAVTAISDDYDTAVALASQIDLSLTGKHQKDTGERLTVNLKDSTEAFDDNKYIETLLFEIK